MMYRTNYLGFLTALMLMTSCVATAAEPNLTIRFRAVDEDGNGVGGAKVSWLPYTPKLVTTFPTESEQGTTDDDGYMTVDFSQHPAASGNNFEVRVETDPSYAAALRVYPERDYEDPVLLTLKKYTPIKGTIRDVDGKPIADVVVGSSWFPTTRSDAEGQFTLWRERARGGAISFFKEGHAWTSHHGIAGDMELTLLPGYRVTFEVVDASGAPVADAEVSDGRLYLKTDESGKALSVPWEQGEKQRFYAWRTVDRVYSQSEHQEFTVTDHPSQTVRLVLKEVPNTPRVELSISGKVVDAATGEPVRARLFVSDTLSDFDYHAKEKGVTEKDGTFALDGLRDRVYFLQARPTKSTLYGVDGIVEVDCSKASIDGLVLNVAPGCAVSGRVTISDGSEVEDQWILLQHGDLNIQRVSKGGNFAFYNLRPAPKQARLRVGGDSLELTLGEAGTALRKVEMTVLASSDKGHVRGRIVDEMGEPQAGLSVIYQIFDGKDRVGAAHGETDGDGRFEMETIFEGEARIQGVYAQRQYSTGTATEQRSVEGIIVENSGPVAVNVGEPGEGINLVVTVPDIRPISGTVTDETGAAVPYAYLRLMTEKHADTGRNISVNQGQFILHPVPEEPFLIVFQAQGYQTRILELGRDFNRGERNLQVVLKAGPYSEDVPLWTQVTGKPWTQEVVDATIQSENIRRSFDEYRRSASHNHPPKQAPVKPKPSVLIPILVEDSAGDPIARITTHQAAAIVRPSDTGPTTIAQFEASSGSAATVLTNEAGRYEVLPHHLIWAQGTSRQLIGADPEEGDTLPREITLYSQSPLTITVVNGLGEPVSRASVAPLVDGDLPHGQPSQEAPRTSPQGQCVFEWLPPGTYDFVVMPDRMSQVFYTGFRATVVEGEALEYRVLIAPYAKDSDLHQLAALEKVWSQQRHNGDFAEHWKSLKKKERAAIAAASLERVAGPFYLRSDQLLFDALVAVATDSKEAVSHLMRHYREFPAAARHGVDINLAASIEALAGAEAIPFFTESVKNAMFPREARLHAVLALNRIGTPESLTAWRALRDAARLLPEAPQAQPSYTHEERMVESMILAMGLVNGKIDQRAKVRPGAQVADDYVTGTLHWTGGTYQLRRFCDEWVPVAMESGYW